MNKENISIGLKTIDKLEKIFQNKNGKDIVLFKNNNTPIKKEEIRNFVFINKDDNNTSGDLKFIYDNIESMFEEGQLSDNCIKSIVFLIKNDIKVSINNLEKLFLILEGKEIISEEALDFLYNQDLEIKEQKLTKRIV